MSDSESEDIQQIIDTVASVDLDTEAEYEYRVLFDNSVTGDDIESIKAQLIDDISTYGSTTSDHIPERACPCSNNHPVFKSIASFYLTPKEAEHLSKDPRVKSIALNIHRITGVNPIQTSATQSYGRASVSGEPLASNVIPNHGNAGFAFSGRDDFPNFPLGNTSVPSSATLGIPLEKKFLDYEYHLTGKDVDVVIVDTGIYSEHVEWQDSQGNSRLQQINWFNETGVPDSDGTHYRDTDQHGTHCAGSVAGKTYGWAKDSHIYALNILGTGSIDNVTAFEALLQWHKNKPINTATGFKRPTVVSNSWGYLGYYGIDTTWIPQSVKHNGTNYQKNVDYTDKESLQALTGIKIYESEGKLRSPDPNHLVHGAIIRECIDAGIHIVFAAGNASNIRSKLGDVWHNNTMDISDLSSLPTWMNNYEKDTDGQIFTNRSMYHDIEEVIMVGNLDVIPNDTSPYVRLNSSSNRGPRVDMYTCGTSIVSAATGDKEFWPTTMSENNSDGISILTHTVSEHPDDPTQKVTNMTGTSMACPQVAGIIACILEANPGWSPLKVKRVLEKSAIKDVIRDDQTHGPGNYNSNNDRVNLYESNNYVVKNPFLGINKINTSSDQPYINMKARYSTRLQPAIELVPPTFTFNRKHYDEEIILETSGIPDGTVLNWAVGYEGTLDETYLWLDPFTPKTITIQNNTGSFSITAKNKYLLGDVQDSGILDIYIEQYPNVRLKLFIEKPDIVLNQTAGAWFYSEGTTQTYKWEIRNVPNGTPIYYAITGAYGVFDEDFNTPRSGSIIVTNGEISLPIELAADGVTVETGVDLDATENYDYTGEYYWLHLTTEYLGGKLLDKKLLTYAGGGLDLDQSL